MAREFGGRRAAQLTAALGAATAPARLGADHMLGPTAFDLLSWSALALIVARIGRTGDTRLWLAAGAALGLGLANKHSIGFFAVAHHGWATIAMTRALAQENGGPVNAVVFLVSQVFMAAPVLIGVWLAGLRFLWRSGRPAWRALAWSYGLLIVFLAVTSGAKPYYVAAAYFFLLAAGAVAVEQRRAQAPPWPVLAAQLRRDFAQVRVVATLGNAEHVANQDDGGRVYLCHDPRQPWDLANIRDVKY
jgi:hypothetical protein